MNDIRLSVIWLTMLILLPVTHEKAFAWEADVHEALTEWLARKAGISAEAAHEIAKANQGLDDSASTDAIKLTMKVLLEGDTISSQLIQEYHFPSYPTVPFGTVKDRKQRRIKPGESFALSQLERSKNILWSAIEEQSMTGKELSISRHRALIAFGHALHGYQDSWSHQENNALCIHPDLTFSHDMKRGGTLSHQADLTCNSQGCPDAAFVDMAKNSFEHLVQYCEGHNDICTESRKKWKEIVDSIERLGKLRTKNDKRDWFRDEGGYESTKAEEIASKLSLPRNTIGEWIGDVIDSIIPDFKGITCFNSAAHAALMPESFVHRISNLVDISGPPTPSPSFEAAGDTFEAFLNGMLQSWLVKQEIFQTVHTYFDEKSVLRQYSREGEKRSDKSLNGENIYRWLEQFLSMWLLLDHGVVERLGHGQIWSSDSRLPILRNDRGIETDILRYDRSEERVLFVERNQRLADLLEGGLCAYGALDSDEAYGLGMDSKLKPHIVIIVLKNAPRDILWFIISHDETRPEWKVRRVYWAAL